MATAGVCSRRADRDARHGGTGGFTLVEVAITLAVLGVAAVLATPSLRAWQDKLELRSAVGAVSNALVASRAQAILERRSYTVSVDYDNDTWRVAPVGGEGRRWKGVDIHADASDPDCPPLSGRTVSFRPNGTATAAGFEAVYLRSTSPRVPVRYRVKVLGATGKVSVERLAGGTWVGAS